jgi:hypothetical protein
VREKLEADGDVSTVDTRTDTQGRQQPAHKEAPKQKHTLLKDDAADESLAKVAAAAIPRAIRTADPPPMDLDTAVDLDMAVNDLRRLLRAHPAALPKVQEFLKELSEEYLEEARYDDAAA